MFPIGGTPLGLSDLTVIHTGHNAKDVKNVLFGVSRILTRRWMVAVDGSRTFENGYLTEPYKVISLMDSISGAPVGQLTDKRPTSRQRSSLMFSSVYHLTDDVLYSSYRYYRDTWNVRSHTIDLKYRHELGVDTILEGSTYVEPLLRYYHQTAASFYTVGLVRGAPLPDFATSDYRLGQLQTITLGATFGFRPDDSTADWTVRAQYMHQTGNGSPPNAVGIQRTFDLVPPVNSYAIVIGYSFDY